MKNARYIFLASVCFSFVATYMNRSTISIALVSICKKSPTNSNETLLNNGSSSFANESHVDTLYQLYFSGKIFTLRNDSPDDHEDLDVCEQANKGLIVSASYWSSLVFQIPFGILISRFGGFAVLLIGMILTGVLSIALPFVVYQSVWLVILARFLIGTTAAATSPAVFHLIDVWMLKKDKAIASAFNSASQTLGIIVTLGMAGIIDEYFSWPGLFYYTGIASFISSAIVILTVRDNPSQVSWMSPGELKRIQDEKAASLGGLERNTSKSGHSTPWLKIMTNGAFLSLLIFRFASSWINTIYATQLTFFLDEVPKMSLKDNGFMGSATQVTRIVATLSSGYLSEFIIRRNYLSRVNTRKAFGLFLGAGQALSLLLIPLFAYNVPMLSTLLLLSTFVSGFSSGCTIPMHYELSSRHSVAIFTISNTAVNLTGILVPILVGLMRDILSHLPPVTIWAIVFGSSAALIGFACILFLIFGNAEDQDHKLDGRCEKLASIDSQISIITMSETPEGCCGDLHKVFNTRV